MKIESIQTDTLRPAQYNPRKDLRPGDPEYEKIKRSIESFGYVEPIIVNKDHTVIGGHQRLKVLEDLGEKEITCVVVDLPKDQEKALNLALNKIRGDWDMPKLRDLLDELQVLGFDASLTGFDSREIDEIMAEFSESPQIIEDEPPDPPVDPITRPGDIWQLGAHRVLCGDATKKADMQILMGGKQSDMVFTDPPYNVNYGEKAEMVGHKNTDRLQNDNLETEAFFRFLLDSFLAMYDVVVPGGAVYVCHAESTGMEFRKAFVDSGFLLKQCIIWAKSSLVIGRQDYQWKHEPILYGWKPGAAHRWYGGRKSTTVLEDPANVVFEKRKDHTLVHLSFGLETLCLRVPDYQIERQGKDDVTTLWRIEKSKRNDVHPTMKPVSLCARAIQNSSKPGGFVLDPFGGSGSTLIACEQTGRTGYASEIDPGYCDVIKKRWENLTGKKTELVRGEVDSETRNQTKTDGAKAS